MNLAGTQGKCEIYYVNIFVVIAGRSGRGAVRNLGKPLALCQRYYEEGADEVITGEVWLDRVG